MNENLPLLITGCPRSGTSYIATVMREVLGLRFGHEIRLKDGLADWRATDDHYDHKPFKTIFHQVRHPLSTISSFDTMLPQSRALIEKTVKVKNADSKLFKFMKYWYHWNVEAESLAPSLTYRIENLADMLVPICTELGIKEVKQDFYKIPKDINTRKGSPRYHYYSWSDLRKENSRYCKMVRDLSEEYGYT